MKTRTLYIAVPLVAAAFAFYSFKPTGGGSGPRTIMIGVTDKFILINNGEAEPEKRPLTEKIRPMDPDGWRLPQPQLTAVLNEFRAKGYRFSGSTLIYNQSVMILEKD